MKIKCVLCHVWKDMKQSIQKKIQHTTHSEQEAGMARICCTITLQAHDTWIHSNRGQGAAAHPLVILDRYSWKVPFRRRAPSAKVRVQLGRHPVQQWNNDILVKLISATSSEVSSMLYCIFYWPPLPLPFTFFTHFLFLNIKMTLWRFRS